MVLQSQWSELENRNNWQKNYLAGLPLPSSSTWLKWTLIESQEISCQYNLQNLEGGSRLIWSFPKNHLFLVAGGFPYLIVGLSLMSTPHVGSGSRDGSKPPLPLIKEMVLNEHIWYLSQSPTFDNITVVILRLRAWCGRPEMIQHFLLGLDGRE